MVHLFKMIINLMKRAGFLGIPVAAALCVSLIATDFHLVESLRTNKQSIKQVKRFIKKKKKKEKSICCMREKSNTNRH